MRQLLYRRFCGERIRLVAGALFLVLAGCSGAKVRRSGELVCLNLDLWDKWIFWIIGWCFCRGELHSPFV